MFAGADDSVVPAAHGRELFEAVLEPKEFVTVPLAGHPVAARLWI